MAEVARVAATRATEAIKTNEMKSFADIVKKTNEQQTASLKETLTKQPTPTPAPTITLTDKVGLKMMALVLEAHIANIGSSDGKQFGTTLTKSLKANFGIDVKFPDHRDSEAIFRVFMTGKEPDYFRLPQTSTSAPAEAARQTKQDDTHPLDLRRQSKGPFSPPRPS